MVALTVRLQTTVRPQKTEAPVAALGEAGGRQIGSQPLREIQRLTHRKAACGSDRKYHLLALNIGPNDRHVTVFCLNNRSGKLAAADAFHGGFRQSQKGTGDGG